MGTMTYAGAVVEFDDRLLTHLHLVIMRKFRRGEAFVMSWIDGMATGDGRSSIWLTPTNPIYFKFDGSRVPAIDQSWIDLLSASAESQRGLIVLDENGSPAKSVGTTKRPEIRRLTRA